jgi:hypothetical protein
LLTEQQEDISYVDEPTVLFLGAEAVCIKFFVHSEASDPCFSTFCPQGSIELSLDPSPDVLFLRKQTLPFLCMNLRFWPEGQAVERGGALCFFIT